MNRDRTYFCIDMKSFYASVECAERNLNPFETNLVVADVTRGRNALCLAITPPLKKMGIASRCRLSDIPGNIPYEIAPPRMALYIKYAAEIYGLYLNYFSPEDIHVYSIDESFIDVTDYLTLYRTDAVALAQKLMNEIAFCLGIPSTAGVGTNLFLAKVALDITAKRVKNHIGVLDERTYRETLWDHKPITDFWMIAAGTARRLERFGVTTMRGITELPEETLYRTFGVNAELLLDHAWGREPCLIEDIKNYKSKAKSVSFSQILPRDYTYDEAITVLKEMTVNGTAELMKRKVICKKLGFSVGYSGDFRSSNGGSLTLPNATALPGSIMPFMLSLFESVTDRNAKVRRMAVSFENVCDEQCEGYDLFSDFENNEKERSAEKAVLELNGRFGKNAVLRGVNYRPEATQKERNGFIGGHRAGNTNDTAGTG